VATRNIIVRFLGDTSGLTKANATVAGSLGALAKRTAAFAGIATAGAGFAQLIKLGNEYQLALNKVQAVTGATDQQMQQVRKTAKQLGADLTLPGVSAATAANAMVELAKGGFSVKESMQAAKGTLALAAAAQIEAARAAEIQVNTISMFSLKASHASRVADVLASASNASSIEIEDLATSLKYIGPVANSMRISLEDTATAVALLGNAGIKGDQAGTSLRTMLVRLAAPTEKARDGLQALGIKAFDASGKFVGFRAITEQLARAKGRLTDQEFQAAAAMAFGREALSAVNAVANSGVKQWDKLRVAVAKQGAASDLAAAKMKGLGGAWEGFKSQIETLAIVIYEAIAPALESIVRAGAELVGKLGEAFEYLAFRIGAAAGVASQWFTPAMRNLGEILRPVFDFIKYVAIGSLVALELAWSTLTFLVNKVVGPTFLKITEWLKNNKWAMAALIGATAALLAKFLLLYTIGKIVALFKTLVIVVKATALAFRILTLAMISNPIGLIIAAVGALVGVFVHFWQTSAGFRQFWINLWAAVKNAFIAAWNGIKNGLAAAWNGLKAGFHGLMVAVHAVADAFVWFWEKVIRPVGIFIGNAFRILAAVISAVFVAPVLIALELLGDAFQLLWEHVIKPWWDSIVKACQGVGRGVMWLWTNAIRPAINGIAWLFRWIYDQVIKPWWDANVRACQGVARGVMWLWNNAIRPAINGIAWLFRWLFDHVIKPWWDSVVRACQGVGRGVMWLWNNAIRPAVNGIASLFRWLWNSVIRPIGQFVQNMWRAIGLVLQDVWNNRIKPAFNAIATAFRNLYNWTIKPIGDLIRRIWNGIGEGIRWVWRNIIRPAFDAIKTAVDTVGRAFDNTVKWIGRVWNSLKDIVRKPINAVIRFINDKFIKNINKVTSVFGLTIKMIPLLAEGGPVNGNLNRNRIGHLAKGGRARMLPNGLLHGPGGPRDDKIPAWLSNKEYVVNARATARNIHLLEGINSGRINESDIGLRLAQGGQATWQNLWGYIKGAFPNARLTSAYRRGDPGQHGKGLAIDVAGPRPMDTRAMGNINRFIANRFPQSYQLIYTPGINLFRGRRHRYNAATRADHFDHVHWSLSENGARMPGGIGGAVRGAAGDALEALLRGLHAPFKPVIGGTRWGQMLNEMISQYITKIGDWVRGKEMETFGGMGAPGNGPVVGQVRAIARKFGWGDGPQWNALSRLIQKESSWNPRAQNPTSTAYGLFQFLNSTWGTVGARKTSNPAQQAQAGLTYIKRRYGSPMGALAFHNRNNWYDTGGWWESGTLGVNASGRREAVLDPDQSRAFKERTDAGFGNTYIIENLVIHTQELDKDEFIRILDELTK